MDIPTNQPIRSLPLDLGAHRPIPLPTSLRRGRLRRLALPPANPDDGAIYVRISDDKEGAGLGVERQEADCRRLAELRGLRVVAVFSDNDTSAYKRDVVREDYERMMDRLSAGHFSTVIVWHLDRLWRKPRELEDMIELCEQGERRVVSCYGDYDLSNPDGCFMARLVVAQANKESADKSRRIQRKMLELAEAGKYKGHPRAFGFEQSGMIIRPDEAALIREASQRVQAGEGLRSVCRDFSRRGVKGAKGGLLSRAALRRTLLSPRTSGQREHNGVILGAAEWPAILTPEDTRRLRAVLDDPARRVTRIGRTYLLSGFLRCGHCGAKMVGRPSHGVRSYVCAAAMSSGTRGCGRIQRNAAAVDALITEAVFAVFDSPALEQAMAGDDVARTNILMAEIAEDQAQIAELRTAYASRQISLADWLETRAPIEQRIAERSSEFAALTVARRDDATLATYAGRGGALREAWPDLSLDQRRTIIDSVLDHAVVVGARPGRNTFDPTKIRPVWKVHAPAKPSILGQAA